MTLETAKFKVFCVEAYRHAHDMDAPSTVDLFNRYGVFDLLNIPEMQWQPLEDTVREIGYYIANRRDDENPNQTL